MGALREANANLLLGLVGPEALPDIAASALEEGWDSPSLRIVAGLCGAETGEARCTFLSALAELGISEVTKVEAVTLLSHKAARELLAGVVSPIDVARLIWDLSLELPDNEAGPEFDTFIYAASEWDERPDDHDDFERGIVDAARSLLNS